MMKWSLPILFALLGVAAVAQLAEARQKSSKSWLDSPRDYEKILRSGEIRVHEGSRQRAQQAQKGDSEARGSHGRCGLETDPARPPRVGMGELSGRSRRLSARPSSGARHGTPNR